MRFFLKIYIFFIDFREGERGRDMDDERESFIGCLLHAPDWGWSRQPGHVP
jgi:hypothetical protein